MSNTFYETVLPATGMYCIAAIPSGTAPRHKFVGDINALGDIADQVNSGGVDTFFALATFDDQRRRKAENAQFLRSFFLDIDCGPGKPYEDQGSAAVALNEFMQATGLPAPTIVNSGGGLHVYWSMDEDIPYAEWKLIATRFKRLVVDHGMACDLQVIADGARVLRCPGTNNYKKNLPRPAQLMRLATQMPLAEFEACLPAPSVDLSAAKQFGVDVTTKALAATQYKKSFFRLIVERSVDPAKGCQQVQRAMEHPEAVEEPLWRGLLSVAWHCEDAENAIHTISEGHPEYDYDNTLTKAQQTKGPYTCEWFKMNYPTGCAGCRHAITSPIALGGEVEATVPKVSASGEHVYEVETVTEEGESVIVEVPKYAFPYFRPDGGGVWRHASADDKKRKQSEDTGFDDPEAPSSDEEGSPICIYPYDIYIIERMFDGDENGDGQGEVVAIAVHTPTDGVRKFYVPLTSLLVRDKMQACLLKHGVAVYGARRWELLMQYFDWTLRKMQAKFSASRTRSQMGWTPDMQGFVVGEHEYSMGGTKLAPPASSSRSLAPAFEPRGSLENWRKIVDFYARPGQEVGAFTIGIGFASPLLALIGGDEVKGAVINLVSNESGTGKTTAQYVVNSIFGSPDRLLLSREDTALSRYQRLGVMNSLAVTVDEMTNVEADEASDFVYMCTAGRGKHRMEANSNQLRANKTTWRSFTITSSNASMADKLGQFKSTADGELRRLLDVYFRPKDTVPKEVSDRLFRMVKDNYGIAGPIYAQYIVNNKEQLIGSLEASQRHWDAALNLGRSDRFYSVFLATLHVALSITNALRLTKYDIGSVLSFACGVVNANRTSNTSGTNHQEQIASEAITTYLMNNLQGLAIINNAHKAAGVAEPQLNPNFRGSLKMRFEPDTGNLWIPSADFKRHLVSRQIDIKLSLRTLAEAGLVKYDGNEHVKRIAAGVAMGLAAPGVRCFCFDGSSLGIDTEALVNAKISEEPDA